MNLSALSFSNIYNSFKNNDYATGTLTVSGTIAAGAFATYSGSVTLNRNESVSQIYYSTSVNSRITSTGLTYLLTSDSQIIHDNGSTPTFPGTASYGFVFTVSYTNTGITLTANAFNPYIETLTLVTETISFQAYTFITPFAS